MTLARVSPGIVALLMMAPLFGGGEGPVEVVQPVEATEELTSWSTQTGWWLPNSHYPKQAIYHEERALVFVPDPHSVWRTYVYDYAPPDLPTLVGEVQLHHSLRGSFLPVSHSGDLYAFGSDSSNGGEVYLLDPATWEQTAVAEEVAVGEYAAGVSTGDAIYIFPGSAAALDAAQMWRFDPLSGSLTATGIAIPFSGSDNDARHATALWTGSEVVLVGGHNQDGRVFTWTPGDDHMKVLPFDLDGSQDSLNGHAFWTGASIYVLGEPQARDIIRITLDPPKFEKLTMRLVEDANGGDVVWDGSDAYIFTFRNGIIRFHPWESDLPRFTLGQDFALNDGLDRRTGGINELAFCTTDVTIAGKNIKHSQNVWNLIFEDEFHGCIKGVFSAEVEAATWLPSGKGQLAGVGATASVYIPGSGWKDAVDAVLDLLPTAASALTSVLEGLSGRDSQAWLSHGGYFVLERGCAEQNDLVGATATFDFLASGGTAAAGVGIAGGMASLVLKGAPWVPFGQGGGEFEIPLKSVESIADIDWFPADSDEDRMGPAFDESDVTVALSTGFGETYLSGYGYQTVLAGVGGAVAAFEMADGAGSEDDGDGFELLEVRYDFVDESAPWLSWHVTGPWGREGWFTGDVVVRATAGDSETCVEELVVDGPPPVQARVYDPWDPTLDIMWNRQGTSGFTATATNHKGIAGVDSRTVAIDSVSPESSHSLSGIGQNGWYRSCVDLTITTVDSTSGPAEQFSDRQGDGEAAAGSREFCAEGIEPFTYWAWDVAGNIEDENEGPVLKIDRTPPTGGTGAYEGQEGYDDWYQSCVTVPVIGADALSGFDFAEYAINGDEYREGEAADVCDEGFNSVHVIAHDVAGNVDIPRSSEVKIDDTDPTVDTSVPFLTLIGNPAQVSYEAHDELSGLYATVGVEVRYEPLIGTPTDYEQVCTDESYEASHSGSCEVPLEEPGRYCFRTWVGDRALNVGVSDSACTTYASL